MANDIATPPTALRGLASAIAGPALPALAARAFAAVSRWKDGPVRWGNKVFVGRHADAMDVLSRDLDFRIGPVNAAKIEAVNGPFILGLDRGAAFARDRAALYRALAQVDFATLRSRVASEAATRIEAGGAELDCVGGYARPIAASTAQSLFGVAAQDLDLFMDVARAIFAHVFLNPSNEPEVEARALRAAPLLRDWLVAGIAARRAHGPDCGDLMGTLLADPSVAPGPAGDDFVRRTLGGMLVGSIDTTASCVAKIMAVIGRDARLAAGIAGDVEDPARLRGWCWEALRRWPHNPIVLRSAFTDTQIAGVDVRAGDQIYIYTQAAMLDASAFPEPLVSNPERPLRPYLHFGGGLHLCAGRDINAFQIPLLVGALVRRGVHSVAQVEWAGPFPNHLRVAFNRSSR